ncbi:ATP synthase F0 subunit A [Candidatus Poribacteria bacterium]|nr:MAG: ATP synthase F0 subunit A [Candidatus Poribacteria bacterium]
MKKISFICLVVGLTLIIVVAGSFAADNGHRSLLSPISKLLPDNIIPEPTRWHQPDLIPNTYFAVVVLTLFFVFVTRKLKRVPEGKGQTLLEVFVGGITDFFGGILGDHGKKYVPFVGSLFIFILFLNFLGIIPGLQPPTADLNTTLALGITAVLGVQIIAIKELGIGGYLRHLAGDPPLLGILMFPLEVIAQLSRAGSLAVRLFGNIFGEKSVVIELTALGIVTIGSFFLPIPVQIPMLFFGLFAGFLQAFVFTILTSIYIVLFIEHDEEAHEAHH